MKPKKLKIRIQQIYDEIENDEPDISTERLLQMVLDRVNTETGEELNMGDITSAI